MGYYSEIKKNQVLSDAKTCINLENIIPNKDLSNKAHIFV